MVIKKIRILIKRYLLFNRPELYSFWISIHEKLVYKNSVELDEDLYLELRKKIINLDNTVQAGVFSGMQLPVEAVCSQKCPKIIGSYEYELQPVLKKLIDNNYDTIINIGCAEGYYAVGFSLQCRKAVIIAVDPLSESRDKLSIVAGKNGVSERIIYKKWVSSNRLNKWICNKTLIIMDCEGSEIGLLNPLNCKKLYKADILVEIHNFSAHPEIGSIINKRFSKTHNLTEIHQSKRNPSNFSALNYITNSKSKELMDEKRPNSIYWLYMENRSRYDHPL